MRLLAGVLLLALSGALGYTAWVLYDGSLPGAPRRGGVASAVRIGTAKDVGPVATVYFLEDDEARDRDRDFDADKLEQSVSVAVAAGPSRDFAVVVELAGGARLEPGFRTRVLHREPGEEVLEPVGPVLSGDAQRFVFRVVTGPESDGRVVVMLSGTAREPAVRAERARFAFESPAVRPVSACPWHEGPGDDPADAGFVTGPDCAPAGEVEVVLSTRFLQVPRFDFAQPQPTVSAAGQPGTVEWRAVGAQDGPLRPIADFTDARREVDAQRLLFHSGVAVGLAAAAVPAGVRLAYSALRPRRVTVRSTAVNKRD